ncbi:hypothetical protein Sango_0558300 [Sesamum angolense]|uniref:Uncharacterized protein n=1 Tax=Sesamum angolense TaxID=2727404 RepID=A0AAE1X5A3_9LAMI|nr:hypothetical protein Sango_0558300 [Sesamum angolense]
MEISVISDAISSIACSTQSLGFSKFILNCPHDVLSLTDTSPDQPPQTSSPFHISAASSPPTRTLTKPRTRKARRVRRKIGWNFGGHGGANWEEFSDNSISDPAFDFVYEILCWIAMSNCLHFAFKKVVRIVADGFGDREKVPMRLTPVC